MHLRHLRRLAAVTVIGNVVIDVGEEELRAQHQRRRGMTLFLADDVLD